MTGITVISYAVAICTSSTLIIHIGSVVVTGARTTNVAITVSSGSIIITSSATGVT